MYGDHYFFNALAVDNKFRKGSGSYGLAKSIVRQGINSITDSGKTEVGNECGLSTNTVGGVISKLRGRQLLGNIPPIPPINPSKENHSPHHDNSQQDVASHTPTIDSESTSSQEFATKEDLEVIHEAIASLSSYFEDDEDEEPSQVPKIPLKSVGNRGARSRFLYYTTLEM